MIEPPSKQLQQVLLSQKLCTARDLRRVRRRVKRLAGDLPAFDSVWLDALVQSQRLTSFQAQAIEAEELDQLRIGPCQVLDRLASCVGETLLARDEATLSLLVVKRVSVPTELKSDILGRLKDLIEKSRGLTHPGLIVPHACSEVGPSKASRRRGRVAESANWPGARVDIAIASRLIEGMTLSELLLRRGRFPANVVLEIARQALDSMSALHERGLAHGEISLRNMRLTVSGQLVLVDAGISAAVQPELLLNAFTRPDRYDGIAPELIGTGQKISPTGDLYALGTVLWQLLAGRPPFPTGDPLAKLAAHQTQRVPDVRELAPETPALLARTIEWLTQPQLRRRPKSARDVLNGVVAEVPPPTNSSPTNATKTKAVSAGKPKLEYPPLGVPKRSGRSVLSRFASSFQQPPVRRLPKTQTSFAGVMALATAVVLLAAGTVIALHGRSRQWVLAELPHLRVQATSPEAASSSDVAAPLAAVTTNETQTLPAPDAKGVIELDADVRYRASKILWQGHRLTVKTIGTSPARIIVKDEPLWLRADQVVLENIRVESETESPGTETLAREDADAESTSTNPAARNSRLMIVQSQNLMLAKCQLISTVNEVVRESSTRALFEGEAVAWAPRDAQELLPRQLIVRDTQFVGPRSTLNVIGRDHTVTVENVVKVGGGPFLWFDIQAGRKLPQNLVTLKDSTLRDSGAAFAVKLREGRLPTNLNIKLFDDVFALKTRDGQKATDPLLLLVGDRLAAGWDEVVSISSTGSVTAPGLIPFEAATPDGSRRQPVKASKLKLTGMASVEFTFQSPSHQQWSDSLLDEFKAPLASETLPGISDVPGSEPMPAP